MPIVPTVQGRQVQSTGVQTGGFTTPQTQDAFGALSGVGEKYIGAVAEAKQRANVALSQEASLKLSQAEEDLKTKLYSLKGQNALGKGLEFTQQYDEQIQSLSASLPDDASRQMFMQQAQQQRIQFQGNVGRYEQGQVNEFESNQYDATRQLQIQKEADSWNNPHEAVLAKNIRTVATARYGASRGWSQEQILAAIEKDNLAATEMRAKNYAVDNPRGWMNGEFSANDTGGLDMRAVGIVESGGKHLDSDGSIITSSAGAQGRFQLMPETGKELAARRGVQYNPADEEQHTMLASDYAKELSNKYGSELLAGAAYNWGQGNVDKLIEKVGDPRKGEISQADFIKQLPSETQGWISRYRKNKTGMDPVTVYQIDNLANAQIEKQRKLVLNELEPLLNNTMAQLNNGEVPDAVPSIPAIMFSYGEQGKKMVSQLDIAMDNAKTFQAIQYLSPEQQQQELLKKKPEVNDPDYALKLEAYGKLSSLVSRSNETIQAQRDSRRFNEALSMGEKLDPANKSMQKAADYTQTAQNFRINDGSTHDGVVQLVAQTGIIPSQVASQLSAVSRSHSPDVVKQGADLFNRLYDADPASVGDMPKDMQGFYLTVKQLTDSGMAPESAIEQAQNLTYNQTDALKAQLASTQSTKEYKKDRVKAMDSAVSNMAQWFRLDPSADDQTPEAARFRNDYQALYDINYRTTGGNADAAKKMTNQQIARTWSISEVNGSAKLMKYAPEALYNYGPSGWQVEQWKSEKEQLMYGDRKDQIVTSPTQLGITSGYAGPVTTKTPESRVGGELEITPDVLTARNGDYAIMVRTKDKDGIEAVQPFYDKFGSPMRWKPSLEEWEPYKKSIQEREQKYQEEIIRGQEIRGFKDKHHAIDEQYRRFHDDRVNRFKKYFSWSNE
ncbi:lytic transglycosylase [Salmonella enterica subsp. enterica serovar Weltevreden]|uniref:transglycosylase SLT domain-containing protein n=1 Tax=Citrobacter freundii TaxID=546 RepID=UPI00127928F4|nr:transglycosylase SLT domain-containing protein [Citrobacter freundii]EBQ1266056.1 lytic transglycosylase [Salmonella enterica]EBX8802590.1 lytic transglycosylase [Salmonella enterica subsp. enterica serovar Weltevreden]EDS5930401.1 transglycosylase SLT domain-containing protein [Salmonella enterica subsp. enterica serovar Lexington]EEI9221083.1 transglycosylase SLT domain-containing protein [Salmonella enterica subsp. enterica serovar Uganda]HCM5062605.1 transglycosylase SLT domain-containi